ncbi:symmetrical bis(5'-nucleosyl)-tetraphosphatase [Candidatus Kinetoplastibacterium sorsogonicusi]|nr:symmetrical bis(5'-nucleosyl)-tetraphosphatase [Candidatus Kinetoplastibacterium sorsogonicusi]
MDENIWVIGDVHGCCSSLEKLINKNEIFNNNYYKLWFAGDIVNRGPNSLKTILTLMNLDDKCLCVLGNHDIHLLSVASGISKLSKKDSFDDILNSKDYKHIIDWLRFRPIAHFQYNHLLVHAGVVPQWDINKTLSLASEIESLLRSNNWRKTLKKIYGDKPNFWRDKYRGNDRIRLITSVFTRIRLCTKDGHMDFTHKSGKGYHPNWLMPWFQVPNRKTSNINIIFGHWSNLGLLITPNIICLDTGCVWGGKLTAMRLSDRKLIQIQCDKIKK